MEQPQGSIDNGKLNFVCKLKRGLYRLKQAPRIWFERLANHLKVVRFKQSLADASIFVMNNKNGSHYFLICRWFDNITCNNDEFICEVKKKLLCEFEMKDLVSSNIFWVSNSLSAQFDWCFHRRSICLIC